MNNPKESDNRKAKARREKRADKSASKPVQGDPKSDQGARLARVWTVRLEGGGVDEWLVSAPFRPSKGFSLETGRHPAVLRRILEVSEEAPLTP